VSRRVADFGRSTATGASVPLPLEREDFRRALDGVDGVRLARYSRRVDDETVRIRATIAFATIEDLARVPALRAAGFAVVAAGGTHTLTEVVAGSPDGGATPKSLAMIDALAAGATVTLAVETPSRISAAPLGTLSADGRTLTWTATVSELARRVGSIALVATW
jgi:hypothetical protein